MNNSNDDLNRGLHTAVAAGNLEGVSALIEAGAEVNQLDVGRTPLFVAARLGYREVVSALIKARADLNKPNKRRETPLFIAVQRGHLEVISVLIEAKADVNKSEKNSITPLALAASKGQIEVVIALLEAGAHVDQPNKFGITPLHWAVTNGDINVVDKLIDKGADVNHLSKAGEPPLFSAASEEQTDIIELLFNKGGKYESAHAFVEKKGSKECELTLRQSWHAFISKRLEANTDYQDRYQKTKSLISECPVTLEPLYNPIVLFPSGHSIEESSWKGIESAAMASHTAPLCPITRTVITSACLNYALKDANERSWTQIETLYQEMIGSTPLAAASIFKSIFKSEGGSAAGSEGGSAASGKKR